MAGAFELSAPADTSARTLVVYLGGSGATGRLEARLSDASAPVYSETVSAGGNFDRRLSLSYRAASAGQTLTVTWVQTGASGNISFSAASLQGASAPANQAPVLAALADQSVTVGATLTVAVSASDADGPAPLVLTTSALPGSASFSDAGDGSGTLSWTPLAGDVAGSPYSVTVTATDGAGLTTSKTFEITVLADGVGQLTPTLTAVNAGARFNLTSEGSSDWLHWYTGINRKGAVTPQLAVAAIGGTPLAWNPPDSVGRPRYDWSDGTPTASNSTDTFVYQPGVGRGFELSAPADTSARTLVVYLGGSGATGRLEARLSDASAPVYSETVSAGGNFDRRLTLSYRAASAGQTLTVTWVQTGASGNISFSAASLQGASAPANQAPVLAALADQSVTVGATLTVSVSASDADGPAPLVLSTSALPGSASFSDAGNGSGTLSWTPLAGDVAGSPYSVTVTATDGAGLTTSKTFKIRVLDQADGDPPNIIVIMADDLGWGHLGSYGQTRIRTPNLDRMANEGMRFTQFYSGSAVCAPSRSVFSTGMHAGHTSVRNNMGGAPLLPEDMTIAEVLKEAGYTTGLFGKWGLGDIDSTGVPWEQGFDEFYGYLNQVHAHYDYPSFLWSGDQQHILSGNLGGIEYPGIRKQYASDLITERALEFIRNNQRRAVFLADWL